MGWPVTLTDCNFHLIRRSACKSKYLHYANPCFVHESFSQIPRSAKYKWICLECLREGTNKHLCTFFMIKKNISQIIVQLQHHLQAQLAWSEAQLARPESHSGQGNRWPFDAFGLLIFSQPTLPVAWGDLSAIWDPWVPNWSPQTIIFTPKILSCCARSSGKICSF